jgi:ferredoxin
MTDSRETDRTDPTIPAPLLTRDQLDDSSARIAVQYDSRGCLLILMDRAEDVDAVRLLSDPLHTVVLCSDRAVASCMPENVAVMAGVLLELSGYLGRFKAMIQGEREPLALGMLCPGGRDCFDLVLDLKAEPVLDMDVPPLGYYAPRGDPAVLQRALAELPALVGTFYKPKFFEYTPARCVHQRKGVTGCTRCIDACSAQAIASAKDRIEIDASLCQGCGTCALVCPTGAIVYTPNPVGTLLQKLRTALHDDMGTTPSRPWVLFHDNTTEQAFIDDITGRLLPPESVSIALRQLAAAGIETWLTAIAEGAAGVIVLVTDALPPLARRALQAQLDLTRRILTGMGYDPGILQVLQGADGELAPVSVSDAALLPAPQSEGLTLSPVKRAALDQVLDVLVSVAPGARGVVPLGSGAPFGEVRVDREACTLCMSCVNVCPTRALQQDGEQNAPQLRFSEDRCVQCGICAAACPEDAIRLAARFVYDRQMRKTPRVLSESQSFCCITCGKPFTTKAIVERMTERLKDNPSFQGDGITVLQQCPQCRSRYDVNAMR